jgi:hypothetical protein
MASDVSPAAGTDAAGVRAVFASARARTCMYESFYLRAVSPDEPVGIWIRYTVEKAAGHAPSGALWCTVFDARRGRPFMHRVAVEVPRAPADAWIALGEAAMGPDRAHGVCGDASWSLHYRGEAPELRHLSPAWLYRAPLPRTKLTSPAPLASFDGVLELAGREAIELRGWPGMVGHNWGSEHAERWIWLHGAAFAGEPRAWLDVALGRVRVGGRLTPWVANGAVFLDGRRHRLGGIAARGTRVAEGPDGCSLELSGEGGLRASVSAMVPGGSAAHWRYADPAGERSHGGGHDVINCSVATLELSVTPGAGGPERSMRSEHGGVYELGARGAP